MDEDLALCEAVKRVAVLRWRWSAQMPRRWQAVQSYLRTVLPQLVWSDTTRTLLHKLLMQEETVTEIVNEPISGEIAQWCLSNEKNWNYVLVPHLETCTLCDPDSGTSHLILKQPPFKAWFYSENHFDHLGLVGEVYNKTCTNCGTIYMWEKYVLKYGGDYTYYVDRHESDWWCASRETYVARKMMERAAMDLKFSKSGMVTMNAKFNACVDDIVGVKRGSTLRKLMEDAAKKNGFERRVIHSRLKDRSPLTRKRFSDAFNAYMLHVLLEFYLDDETLAHLLQSSNLESQDSYIDRCVDACLTAFERHWATHKCAFPGCQSVFVMDANHKCKCTVCAEQNKDFLSIYGFKIPIGCNNYPAEKSTHCRDCMQNLKNRMTAEDYKRLITEYNKKRLKTSWYLVEWIDDKRMHQGVLQYHVGYAGYTKPEWQNCQNLPKEMKDKFELVNHGVVHGSPYRKTWMLKEEDLPRLLESLYGDEESDTSEGDGDVEMESEDDNKEEPKKCNTDKSKGYKNDPPYVKLRRSGGVSTVMSPCMMVKSVAFAYRAEGSAQWWRTLCNYYDNCKIIAPWIENITIVYDNGCEFDKFSKNKDRRNLNATTKWLAKVIKRLDRMHGKNHVKRCRKVYEIKTGELVGVNTQACESIYKWLSAYKHITYNMKMITFRLLMLFVCHLWNLHNERMLLQQNIMVPNENA